MSSKDLRKHKGISSEVSKVWRRIFQRFLKGDRVVITAPSKYQGQHGIILWRCTQGRCEGKPTHWAVRLDEKDTVTFWEQDMELEN